MNPKPIGVFDSGLGGLTAVRRLRALLPEEDIVFLGDTGRMPYGSRSNETLLKYAREDLNFLSGFGVKAVIVACGTISSTVLDRLESAGIPLCGVVKPASAKAAELTKSGRIGVVGTSASIRSGAYVRALKGLLPDCEVFTQACPMYVPLVEGGHVQPGDRMLEFVTEEYLSSLRDAGIDTLILGCTHFPLISEVISRFIGPEVRLVDAGAEAAELMVRTLEEKELLAESVERGELSCWVTDNTEQFSKLAERFLSEPKGIRVRRTEVGS